tara:strand:- start:4524 stop:6062 length:1539 start_codon:yes stop_codon:yes gene_type:complete
MDNYEENIEDIQDRLDEILGKLGHKLKSFTKGLAGDKYTDADAKGSDPKTPNKDYNKYVADSGSDSERKAVMGKPQLYKIGENYAKDIDDSLLPLLAFEVDEKESEAKNGLVHSSNKDKTLKISPSLEWLFKGTWRADKLGISNVKRAKSRGAAKGGKLITFLGEWSSGAFMGIFKKGVINGGQIIDGYYLGSADGYKLKPWDFKSGGCTNGNGFVMGLRMAKENTKHKKLSIIQVKKGLQIKILDNNDKEHLISVEKGIDYNSLDMKVNGIDVSWEMYNKSSGDFEKSNIQVGSNFSIPGIIDVNKGVQSIEVKTSDYEKKEAEGESEKSSKALSDKFDVKTKRKGWKPGGRGYYLMDFKGDTSAQEKFEKFKTDIDSGFFFKNLIFFKKLVEEGRVDGYGAHPSLAFIFPKQKGEVFKDKDGGRDKVMSYFSDFREHVINNFKSDSISQYYLDLTKKEINENPAAKKIKKSKPAAKKKTAKEKQNRANKTMGKKPVNESLSISSILKKII